MRLHVGYWASVTRSVSRLCDVRANDCISANEPFAMHFRGCVFSHIAKSLSQRQRHTHYVCIKCDATTSNSGDGTKTNSKCNEGRENEEEEDEAEKKNERTSEQQQHNLKWLPFYLRRTLFLSNVVHHRRCSLWRFGAQSFSVLLRSIRLFFFCSMFFRSFRIFGVCVCAASSSTTLFSVAIAVWLLSPVIVSLRFVSFEMEKSVKGKRSPQQQPSQIKEHEILAKNGQTENNGFVKLTTEEEEEKMKEKTKQPKRFYTLFSVFRFRKWFLLKAHDDHKLVVCLSVVSLFAECPINFLLFRFVKFPSWFHVFVKFN